MKESEYEQLYSDFVRRGGIIHRLPTAFCGIVKGAQLDVEHRQAISAYHDEREEQRKTSRKNTVRKWNEINTRPPPDQIQRPIVSSPGRQREHTQSARKEVETEPAESPQAVLHQQANTMTKNKYTNASEEITIFRWQDGRSEIHTVDYQGREYLSRFSQNGQFQGTKWVNKEMFVKPEP